MEPFKVHHALAKIADTYPSAQSLIDVIKFGDELSNMAIARLWLSEGIPYAFREKPGLYESIRSWLAARLIVDPKEIHLTGSGRIGQSIAPHKVGRVFNEKSDLDFFVVSEDLFLRITEDFNRWSYDFEIGKVSPKNSKEKDLWVHNIERIPKNSLKGFIDSFLIPNFDNYQTVKNIAQSMWLLKEKIVLTEHAPKVHSASIRCYRNWKSYTQQVTLNLC